MNTDTLIATITAQTLTLVSKQFGDMKGHTVTVAIRQFLENERDDIDRWIGQLQRKEITDSDFNGLIGDAMADAEISAIEKLDAKKVARDKLMQQIVSLIGALTQAAIKKAAVG